MKHLIQQLDKAFDNKIRLGIMSILVVNQNTSFTELREMLDVTDGNLASHLKTLESASYIRVLKSFTGRKPNTVYEITPEGKTAFENHLKVLEEIIKNPVQ